MTENTIDLGSDPTEDFDGNSIFGREIQDFALLNGMPACIREERPANHKPQ